MPRTATRPVKKPAPRTHVSLSRPNGAFHDSLPANAEILIQRTPWQRICDAIVKDWGRGRWFLLAQDYATASSATTSARITFEKGDYSTEAAEALEVATMPSETEGRVQVFLRLNPELAPSVDATPEAESEEVEFDE